MRIARVDDYRPVVPLGDIENLLEDGLLELLLRLGSLVKANLPHGHA
jgi:hypothetical protein